MKTRTLILIGVAVLLLGSAAVAYRTHHVSRSLTGPQHVYEISNQPSFLTEELAMNEARETLKLDGLDNKVWQPVPDGRTASPDGRKDDFLARNANTPNRGVIMFTNLNVHARFVSVELSGSRLVCQTSIGK